VLTKRKLNKELNYWTRH